MNDLELLQKYAKTNSDEAFCTVVSRHINLVYSVALRRTGNPHSAEEITQAVFIILAKKAASLRKDTVLSAWLFETVRLTTATFQRTEIRRILREQEACMQSQSSDSGTDVWAQVAPLLDDAIGELGDKDRKAIMCRFFEGKSLAEVGQSLGTSEDAAHKRVSRAVEKLRSYFVRQGIGVSTGALAGMLAVNSVHAAPLGMASAVTAAAINGVSTTGSLLALSKGTLKIMAWTKLKYSIAVGTALALTAGSSLLIYQDAMGVPKETNSQITTTSVTARNPLVNSAATNGPVFRWDRIESTDYRQYIANLRAAGCPEPMIRDIVLAEIHQQYKKRAKETEGASRVPYWQKSRRAELTLSQKEKLKKLQTEEESVVRSLFGAGKTDTSSIFDTLSYGVRDASAQVAWLPGDLFNFNTKVAWLPPDKRDAARRAFQETDLSFEEGGYKAAFERSAASLKSILTPDESEEYRLRASRQSVQLREDSRYADVTPDEFKALLKAREQVKDMQDYSADLRRQEIRELTNLLGSERAQDLAIKCDRTYVWARLAAERYGLPLESADQAVQLKWKTQDATDRIQADASLSDNQRAQQLTALRQSAEAALVKYLGPDGARIARSDGDWLRKLTPKP